MSKELKIGLISLIAITLMVWMFQFMKGKNILKEVKSFEVVYGNIEGLKTAAPVEINGFVVGSVSDISLNPENTRTMIIKFEVQGEYRLPKSTIAVLAADNSLVGSKKIILDFDTVCSGADCAESGYRFQPGLRGVLDAMIGKDNLKDYIATLRHEMRPVMDSLLASLSDKDADNAVTKTILNLEQSMSNLASLTDAMNSLIRSTYDDLNTTAEGMAVVSTSLASTNQDMERMIRNFAELSQQLVDADLGTAFGKTDETFDRTNSVLKELETTVSKANDSFGKINDLLTKVEDGKGSLAQLLNNPEIYDNLEATTEHLALLLQDLRLNPKRYVRLSVFGRKGNAYTLPEEDPAYEQQEIKKEKVQANN